MMHKSTIPGRRDKRKRKIFSICNGDKLDPILLKTDWLWLWLRVEDEEEDDKDAAGSVPVGCANIEHRSASIVDNLSCQHRWYSIQQQQQQSACMYVCMYSQTDGRTDGRMTQCNVPMTLAVVRYMFENRNTSVNRRHLHVCMHAQRKQASTLLPLRLKPTTKHSR
jgi:hypothetical protein